MNKFQRYALNLLILIDETGNTITGGDPGETISSRAAKAQIAGKKWGCVLCKFLGWIRKNHCQQSLLPHAGFRSVFPDSWPPANP